MPTSTLSGEAEWPQVAGAVIEAKNMPSMKNMPFIKSIPRCVKLIPGSGTQCCGL